MTLKKLIAKAVNTSPIENLNSILGKDLGELLYKIIDEAKKADKELEIVHEALTELYEIDSAYPIVKATLDKIKKQIK